MGVFKWLRRERVTVSTRHPSTSPDEPTPPMDLRTEEYKRDLAEFQARRSLPKDLPDTPIKRKCGRHSMPVSCADCTGASDPDRSFNYEKKSAIKYKKNSHRRARSAQPDCDAPNIQFLFQNQVFMPGNIFPYSEPRKARSHRSPETVVQKQIDFDYDQVISPPVFYKNSSLPIDVTESLEEKSVEEVDGKEFKEELRNGSEEKMWEVMSELKNFDRWADEQLQNQSLDTTKSDDTKSNTSTLGLPVASSYDLDVSEGGGVWSRGQWGVFPVQLRRMGGVSLEQVKSGVCAEINILRKCRHPNIILLMGLYANARGVHVICERCVDTLYNMLHVECRILSVQTSVSYALDVANALLFLRMHGYIHTELSSAAVMLTGHSAKLADLGTCVRVPERRERDKTFDIYSPEPQYVNLTDPYKSTNGDCEPLLSARSSEAYLTNTVVKRYTPYCESRRYRWHAPELFAPDDGLVRPCSKSDVYSLCLILWECCNASIPWRDHSYAALKRQYTVTREGLVLPQDGTYPGSLLALLRAGLALERHARIDLTTLQETLHTVKTNLDEIEYMILPERILNKTQEFTNSTVSPTDSECQSPKNIQHEALIHTQDAVERDTQNPYEAIPNFTFTSVKCSTSEDEEKAYKNYSACSTPINKIRVKLDESSLHRSDSTEYCSILSPDVRTNVALTHDSFNQAAKLSRSFTPKSYKPLHIKVPEFNLDSIKNILKDNASSERSSYNFDIKNYSLPSTPIARSNKLRKNAWLSGDLTRSGRVGRQNTSVASNKDAEEKFDTSEAEASGTSPTIKLTPRGRTESRSSESLHTVRDNYTGLKRITDPPSDFSSPEVALERSRSLNCVNKCKMEEDILAAVNVKPLVAIHERWIIEAGTTSGRSLSLPESTRSSVRAVKPASHCVDTTQQSLPQLCVRRSSLTKSRASAASNGNNWEQYYRMREPVSMGWSYQKCEKPRKLEKSTITDVQHQPMVDSATDTHSIEDFIRDLIRKEVQHVLGDSETDQKELNKRVHNIVDSLKEERPEKSYSRIKISGNNKPLVQITFSRSGENSLQVLDGCVNVTLSDAASREKLNVSLEDTLTGDDVHINALKRCQAFSALQEARSTEDLYIDDDLSTQMQENFGGKVKLIPLHGSLHEILCEKEDDCCLIKLKQENGCDTIYFRCDNSDTESKDAIDGQETSKDTVVFKRSISLIEERIKRVIPKDRRQNIRKLSDQLKVRPKSEVFVKKINKETRLMSNSSPSLSTKDEVELNIENLMGYQDSSSDECLRCPDDDFETLEREIEEDLANSSLAGGCLEKISEENLSVINEDY